MTHEASPEPASFLEPGTKIARYEIVRVIGSGGMGLVYEAKHVDLGKRVAIKVMRRTYAADPTQVQRFVLEARAASRFSHPHIIAVTDVGMEGDLPFMVMEYLEGIDLATKILNEGPQSLADVADLALPVISAVAAAHAEGFVHRDLKPENVFLAQRGRGRVQPVLLDFGIARPLAASKAATNRPHLTTQGLAIGTPSYMSPEQLEALDVDERTDQYALGVILYEATTGQLPYGEEDYTKLLASIRGGPPPRPSLLVRALPSEFDEIVLRALSADRIDRFRTVRDLGRALWRYASALQQAQWAEEFGDPVDVASRLSMPSSGSMPASRPMTLAPPGEAGPALADVSPDALRALPAFEECSDDALRALLATSHAYRFPPHATIVRQGAHGHGCYLLLAGEVDIVKATQGRTWVLARLPAGCSFGQIALVDNLPRTASVVAATESIVVEIARDAFEAMLANTDEIAEALRLHLAITGIRHLRRATKRLAMLLDRKHLGHGIDAQRELVYLQTAVREWSLPVDDALKVE